MKGSLGIYGTAKVFMMSAEVPPDRQQAINTPHVIFDLNKTVMFHKSYYAV